MPVTLIVLLMYQSHDDDDHLPRFTNWFTVRTSPGQLPSVFTYAFLLSLKPPWPLSIPTTAIRGVVYDLPATFALPSVILQPRRTTNSLARRAICCGSCCSPVLRAKSDKQVQDHRVVCARLSPQSGEGRHNLHQSVDNDKRHHFVGLVHVD